MQLENIKAVLSFLDDSVIILNEKSEILFCNQAFCKLFGYTLKEVINKNMSILVGENNSTNSRSAVFEFSQNQKPLKEMLENEKLLCVDSHGREFPTRISISEIHTDQETLDIALVHDISSHEHARQEQETLSHTDYLTTLHNKRFLNDTINSDTSILTQGNNIGVIFLDLDKFKPINDQYGHQIGDEVLKVIALRIKNNIRHKDMAFRVGGDEFIILVANIKNDTDLFTLARKVSDAIENLINVAGLAIHVKASMGACLYPAHADTVQDAINLADQSMYHAKEQGKRIVTIH